MRFNANQKRLCINISIVNDLKLEPRESFGITLERTPDTDDRISIQQDVGEVHIENDDGEVILITLYVFFLHRTIICNNSLSLCCLCLLRFSILMSMCDPSTYDFSSVVCCESINSSWNGDRMMY